MSSRGAWPGHSILGGQHQGLTAQWKPQLQKAAPEITGGATSIIHISTRFGDQRSLPAQPKPQKHSANSDCTLQGLSLPPRTTILKKGHNSAPPSQESRKAFCTEGTVNRLLHNSSFKRKIQLQPSWEAVPAGRQQEPEPCKLWCF